MSHKSPITSVMKSFTAAFVIIKYKNYTPHAYILASKNTLSRWTVLSTSPLCQELKRLILDTVCG